MSEDNNKASAASGLITTLKTNPMALGGVVVAVLLVGLWLGSSGGGGKVEVKTQVAVGQSVVLDNPNGGASHLTVSPGLMSSASEDDKETSVCTVPGGTKGQVEEEQVAGQLPFVKVKILDGDCKGKSGWTSKINVKAGG